MALTRRQYMRVSAEFLHDLAFGAFPGSVAAAWLIRRGVESQGLGGAAIARSAGILWLVFALGLAVSIATGVVRLRYWKVAVRREAVQTKAQLASFKHALFVLCLIVSAAGLYLVQRT